LLFMSWEICGASPALQQLRRTYMSRKMLFGCALAALVSVAIGTAAFAQTPANQVTYFTFSAPFELPGGKTLPAGKYTFKIVDSPSNRHVVQVMSEDGKTMHATLLAIPAQRQDPPDEPEVRFMETAANVPPAVRTWWYPGRKIGHEFIYPKEHARRLAARQRESVLTVATDATTNETMQTADLARINASGQEQVVTAETAAEVAPTTRTAQATTAAGTSTAQSSQPQMTTPRTNTAQTTAAQTSADRTAAPTTADRTTAVPSPADPTATAQTPTDRTATAQSPTDRTTTAQQTTTAPTSDAPMSTPGARGESRRTALPRTSTALPLVGLLGLVSLASAAALRRRRR
jgi:hypothetical protein